MATRDRRWTITPQRGVWIAPGTLHRIASPTPFTLTTCYVAPDGLASRAEGLVTVDSLARALLAEVAVLGPGWTGA